MRTGLSAFATELFEPRHREAQQCDLPMLYIPLHGRGVEPGEDSFSALVRIIWTFYNDLARGKSGSVTPSPGIDETIAQIQAIHALMARHPAIILFDGYRAQRFIAEAQDYALPNLVAAVAGDRLLDVIERLILMPTPGEDGPIDVAAFKRNRFIILSDRPLYRENDYGAHEPIHPHPALRLVNGRSFPILKPQPELLPRILGSRHGCVTGSGCFLGSTLTMSSRPSDISTRSLRR